MAEGTCSMPSNAGYIALLFLLTLGAFYASVFLHELGHAVCAVLGGSHVTSFGLGTSRPFAVASFHGIRIYLCWRRPLQGIAFYINPQLLPSRRQQVFTLAGGIVAHFLLAALAWALFLLWPAWAVVWGILGGINLWMGVDNLIPFQFRVGSHTLRSDGALILTVLRTGSASSGPTQPLSSLQAFRELWQATGDVHILYAHLLAAAQCWISLGDAGRGGELLAEARALPFEPLPVWRTYGMLVEAEVALGKDDTERTGVALGRAEEQFRLLGHEVGLLLTTMVGAELLRQRGEAAEALRPLEALAAHPLVRKRASLRSLILAQRLVCYCDLSGGDPEALLTEYAALPKLYRSLVVDADTFQSAARWRLRQGDGERAAQAYAQALTAVSALDATVTGADRERFRLAKSDLLAEAQQCLRTLGRAEDAARLDAFFPSPEERTRQAKEARERLDARRARWGAALLGFNFAVILLILGAAGAVAIFWPDVSRQAKGADLFGLLRQCFGFFAMYLLVLLTFSTLFGALAGLVLGGLGRLMKGAKGLAGICVLLCALTPWVMWLAVLLMDFFLWATWRSGP
jgi:membrane-associated protease RseP (regulator of RpoE activity)